MRESGILMPIFSLPSNYGIGTFSKEAMKFIDQLSSAGQRYWQVLPLGPTSYGDSPYMALSSFAGNPYFIDLDTLHEEVLLTKEELPTVTVDISENRYIDYELLYKTRFHILRKAYARFDTKQEDFQLFEIENEYWLKGYSKFMAIKNYYNDQGLYKWDKRVLTKEADALQHVLEECKADIGFYEFIQFKFMEQWDKLHRYANSKGVQIIGDIPIYVALDSADSWNWPKLFQFDADLKPTAVAGCPPDPFAITGQLWGNPLYNWEYHDATNYEWWVKRIQHSFKLFDMVRIDHFRGFDEYYSIPFGAKTAEHGTWEAGPGMKLFNRLHNKLGTLNIIAEDLGFLKDTVIKLLQDSGYPGMKILQFGFDSREESDYIPHAYYNNCVVYTGTHDNDTIIGWFHSINQEDRKFALAYLGDVDESNPDLNWNFIRLAMGSVANIAIIPIQDYLGLGSEARINTPSTLGGNWKWRLISKEFTPAIISKIRRLATTYGRIKWQS